MDTQTPWATEAEILATSEAYKCDVFVLREQCINIRWQKFSFDKECKQKVDQDIEHSKPL